MVVSECGAHCSNHISRALLCRIGYRFALHDRMAQNTSDGMVVQALQLSIPINHSATWVPIIPSIGLVLSFSIISMIIFWILKQRIVTLSPTALEMALDVGYTMEVTISCTRIQYLHFQAFQRLCGLQLLRLSLQTMATLSLRLQEDGQFQQSSDLYRY